MSEKLRQIDELELEGFLFADGEEAMRIAISADSTDEEIEAEADKINAELAAEFGQTAGELAMEACDDFREKLRREADEEVVADSYTIFQDDDSSDFEGGLTAEETIRKFMMKGSHGVRVEIGKDPGYPRLWALLDGEGRELDVALRLPATSDRTEFVAAVIRKLCAFTADARFPGHTIMTDDEFEAMQDEAEAEMEEDEAA